MTSSVGVLHLSSRMPYASKIHSQRIRNLNVERGLHPTIRSVAESDLLRDVDVLHLHQLEHATCDELAHLLEVCARHHVRVVFTAHGLTPLFDEPDLFEAKLSLALEASSAVVFLTAGARAELTAAMSTSTPSLVIPHGYVAPPATIADVARTSNRAYESDFLMYGSLRPNRDVRSVILLWALSGLAKRSQMRISLRAPGPYSSAEEWERLQDLALVQRQAGMSFELTSYLPERSVLAMVLGSRALVLPYLYGSHSGQIELAYDLGVRPIISTAGHIAEQVSYPVEHLPAPIVFDWTDGKTWRYGERLLDAMDQACSDDSEPNYLTDFARFREHEHDEFLRRHAEAYGLVTS